VEKIREIADRTYQIQTLKPEFFGVYSVYVINGPQEVLIDPGPASIIPSIQKALKSIGVKDMAYIIPTHIHLDHGGGTGSLAKLFPRAKVLLHELGKKHLIDPSRLINSTKMAFGDDFEKFHGSILPVPEDRVKSPADGEIIPIDDRDLQIIHAPGHAPHHIAVFDLKTKGLFCGEALGMRMPSAASSPLPNAAPPGFDPEIYLETIKKLEELKPSLLFYAHDGIGRDPENLIASVAENTRVVGDMILKILREGETGADITSRIQAQVATHFGINKKEMDMQMIVGAYRHYFKKIGMIET